MMKTLLLILSVMTWTVTSNKTVSGEGELLPDVVAAYANTYNKGQVRANDTATLVLSALGGATINGIEVYVKSNKSAGAGQFTVTADGTTIASKSGSLAEWVGAYDNQEYHAITLYQGNKANVNELSVCLAGTVSSLYIDRYVISYTAAPVHTVTLMSGANTVHVLTEQKGGAGVLLPSLPDCNDWHFVAWTEQPFYTVNTMPDTWYAADERYYPSADETLWAVYAYESAPSVEPVTDLQPGMYIYYNTIDHLAVSGVPVNGRMDYAEASIYNGNQFYEILFNAACDSATIQHVETGTYIGFNGKQLAARQSVWCVYHNGDKTLFYTKVSGKTYALLPAVYHASNGGEIYTDLFEVLDVSTAPTVLVHVPQEIEEEAFTCYPETGRDIESVPATSREIIIPIGNYQLRVSNGKKTIRL